MRVAIVVGALGLLTACAGVRTSPETEAPAKAEEGRPVILARSYTLESRVLKETRRINVYLPPGYDKGQARLPVLYLLDGGEQEDFMHIAGLAQLASLSHTIREMIVVGIEDTDRRRDFTYPSQVPEDRKLLPTSGGSAAFREFLAQEVKPWVEARYRTSGETLLMGESLAGLFIVETFLRQPELFGSYIAVSPSLWWSNQSLSKESPALLRQHPAGPRTLYLTMGNEGGEMPEMQQGLDVFVAALKANTPTGLQWHYEPMPDELHSTIFHPAALRALRKLLPPPPEEASH
ncbi:alpha/beta hydrolase [Pyxidicoccus parkwayensis]|uniref:Alpha/beta hydrolase n=1 Tax=Pyxidicoccus parkwayensis TaxID=2813578 RepID=A0ABX7NQN2_9BACT|nr:alpha/beta hydrolase-fold protein [Pyxidicoccus parkwaysis]QSQ21176.1 alpha/beta hydrolase [Pyxidicoccus parkwaysis]